VLDFAQEEADEAVVYVAAAVVAVGILCVAGGRFLAWVQLSLGTWYVAWMGL
jgi:hypothetical protein